jgi:hypothetical protein
MNWFYYMVFCFFCFYTISSKYVPYKDRSWPCIAYGIMDRYLLSDEFVHEELVRWLPLPQNATGSTLRNIPLSAGLVMAGVATTGT